MRMPYANSSGIRIAYDDLGSGEPALLLIPGWCATRAAFSDFADRLARSRRVLALDWRGHGASGPAAGDFGHDALVEDALAVIRASGARIVVPVATAHAGWVALDLARKLGSRVPRVVLLDWIVTRAPPPFLAGLDALQDDARREAALDALFAMWRDGAVAPRVDAFLDSMRAFPGAMWARAAREIAARYAADGSPLDAIARLPPGVEVLHAYAQPKDPAFLAAQRAFEREHAAFRVEVLPGRTHFPTIETPRETAEAVEAFLAQPATAGSAR